MKRLEYTGINWNQKIGMGINWNQKIGMGINWN